MNLRDKIVVITGASSGIGAAAAFEFADRGARVVMVSRNAGRLERAREELAGIGKTEAMTCDVSDSGQVSEMARQVLDRFGQVDVLVNNAGYAVYGTVSQLSVGEIEGQMRTNYLGMVYCTKGFLPSMIKRNRGHIVNVASVAASVGLPGMAPYCASKFAMLGFSEGLKHELHETGVGVTVVSPITVRTNFFDHSSFGRMRRKPYAISSKRVARAIVKASASSRLEIVVPSAVRGVVWLKQTLPYLINPMLGSSFRGIGSAESSPSPAPEEPRP